MNGSYSGWEWKFSDEMNEKKEKLFSGSSVLRTVVVILRSSSITQSTSVNRTLPFHSSNPHFIPPRVSLSKIGLTLLLSSLSLPLSFVFPPVFPTAPRSPLPAPRFSSLFPCPHPRSPLPPPSFSVQHNNINPFFLGIVQAMWTIFQEWSVVVTNRLLLVLFLKLMISIKIISNWIF